MDTKNENETEKKTATIISLRERFEQLAWKNKQQNAQEVMDYLEALPPDDADKIVTAIFGLILTEVEIGLNLIDTNGENFDDYEFFFFDQIDERFIAAQTQNDCYMCNPMIDPNETEFGPGTHLCLFHRLKLANFVQALGIPVSAVWPHLGHRKVQKHRIVLSETFKKGD